ncbi:hypothetical protein [Lutibacter sp.]|uniref:hypothetical protein n=1 Tax=Lutibacter sp. TaxID=1925666 RepID=UPI00273411D1|nr:hypothetical protein [Lutibacter sp.]MDP3313382.1 hypothetical protein [Lutibacter sp.]
MVKYISFSFLFLIFFNGFSQETENEKVDEIVDAILAENLILENELEKLGSFKIINISLDYNSNTYFSGRDIGVDQYNIAPQITYATSGGFYTGLAGNYYGEFEPHWDVTIGFIGFGKSVGKHKNFNYQFGYSKFFFNEKEDAIYSNTLDFGFGVKTNNADFGTKVTASYIFGDEKAFQFVSSTFGLVKIAKSKSVIISFKPQLNFIVANQIIDIWRIVLIRDLPRIIYEPKEVFDLVNTQLLIPLEVSIKNFQFEIGYIQNFPNAFEGENNVSAKGLFNFSTSYYFNF